MNDILKQIAIFKRTHTGGVLVDITPALREVLEDIDAVPVRHSDRLIKLDHLMKIRRKLAKILEVE